MAQNVSLGYGPNRAAEPLTDAEATQLRTLAAKSTRTPQEAYDLGRLKALARSSGPGRRLLDDVAHEQATSRTQRQRTQRSEKDQRRHNLSVIDSVLGRD